MSLALRTQQTKASLQKIIQTNLQNGVTVSGIKSAVFYYILFKYFLKVFREVKGKGPIQFVTDGWKWLSLVSERFQQMIDYNTFLIFYRHLLWGPDFSYAYSNM